jgi:hypothetical protein
VALALPLLVAAVVGAVIAWNARANADARASLDRAFSTPIEEADVSIDLEARVDGLPQLPIPVRLRMTGPYRSGGTRTIPLFAWELAFTGPGRRLGAALISTGDNAFVSFGGVDYEIGREAIARTNEQIAAGAARRDAPGAGALGLDPRHWLVEPDERESATVAGVDTTRYQSRLDVVRALNELAGASRRAAPDVGGTPPGPLTPGQQSDLRRLAQNARVDVYVADADHTVRRLAVRVPVQIPPSRRAQAGGATGGVLSFSIEFSRVGRPGRIVAPRDARPLEDLKRQIGPVISGAEGGV